MRIGTYISSSEIATLQHELWNDTMEGTSSISKTMLAGAQFTEIASSAGGDIIMELERDASSRGFEIY